MSKILVLTPQMPFPPQQGTSLRNFYILRGLVQNHEVSLLTFSDKPEDLRIKQELKECRLIASVPIPERSTSSRLINLVSNRQPDLSLRLQNDEFLAKLGEELSYAGENMPYDIIQIEGLELAYTIPLIRSLSPSSKVVFDSHNAESGLQQRALKADTNNLRRLPAILYSSIQVNRLRTFETWVCSAVDWVTAVSEEDRWQLLELVPDANISVIPNCIDVSEYATEGWDTDLHYDLLFTGKMDYRPNVDAVLWFAETIWPLIKIAHPQATWAIVGQKPHTRLRHLADLDGVTLTGWVDRIQLYLAGAKVYIMPFRVGSGTRLKLIEAMASGIPVVSTQVGVEGFKVEDDREIMIANQPEEFARAILMLLEEPEKRAQLANAAKSVAQQYDWRKVTPEFDKLYDRLLHPTNIVQIQ